MTHTLSKPFGSELETIVASKSFCRKWPTAGPKSYAAPPATRSLGLSCLKKTLTTCRSPIAYLMALKSSEPDIASTLFALPAAFAFNPKRL